GGWLIRSVGVYRTCTRPARTAPKRSLFGAWNAVTYCPGITAWSLAGTPNAATTNPPSQLKYAVLPVGSKAIRWTAPSACGPGRGGSNAGWSNDHNCVVPSAYPTTTVPSLGATARAVTAAGPSSSRVLPFWFTRLKWVGGPLGCGGGLGGGA